MTTSQPAPPRRTESFVGADTSVPLVDLTVGGLLAARAAEHPDRLALVGTRHVSGETVRLTYAELYDEACRVATALSRLAEPGSFVALWAPNVIEWPIIEYGAALAGVVLVALNPVLREPELRYALEHSGSTVLLYAERSRQYDLSGVVAAIGADFPDLVTIGLAETDRWCAPAPDPAVVAQAPADPALPVMLQYTSGTTGTPKGVLLSHRSIVNDARLTLAAADAAPGAVCLDPLPMFHTAACVIGTLGPAAIGGTHVLLQQFAPADAVRLIREEHVTVLFCVPTILAAIIEETARGDSPLRLDLVVAGAATVPPALIEAAESQLGARVITIYGQTELAPVLTSTRSGDSRERQLGSVGRPLPQVECKIVDPFTGSVVPCGVVGEICARGYQQMIGYLHDSAATAATVDAEGFVHTGDLGSMDAEGYVSLAGRLKELIIRGGENISPAEIEIALAAHPGVVEALVIGLPDARWGQVVAALLRVRQPESPDLRQQLEEHLRSRLSPYKIPSRWFVADGDLPLTATGKIRRFEVISQATRGDFRELPGSEVRR